MQTGNLILAEGIFKEFYDLREKKRYINLSIKLNRADTSFSIMKHNSIVNSFCIKMKNLAARNASYQRAVKSLSVLYSTNEANNE